MKLSSCLVASLLDLVRLKLGSCLGLHCLISLVKMKLSSCLVASKSSGSCEVEAECMSIAFCA